MGTEINCLCQYVRFVFQWFLSVKSTDAKLKFHAAKLILLLKFLFLTNNLGRKKTFGASFDVALSGSVLRGCSQKL